MKRIIVFVSFQLLVYGLVQAQGQVYDNNIKSIKLFQAGDQVSFPIINLGNLDGLELHFDDLSNRVKNYYYTFELRNADWSPSILRPFDYIKGFQNIRISNYRNSSLATTQYIHYQTPVPDRNCYPTKSGNYLLKVFLDNDTSKLVFTRRMVVLENKTTVQTQALQPFSGVLFRTAQRMNVVVQTDNRINVMSPADIKVVILQNNNWMTSTLIDQPTIYRGNYYEYSDEAITSFQAAKEFRWADLRSFRMRTDRVQEINNRGDTTRIELKPDPSRNDHGYVYFRDLNGMYTIETYESINPYWQGDYAEVTFNYYPPGNRQVAGNDIYIFGEFTNYGLDTSGKMIFNPDKGAYEKTMFLKQGYYNYLYAAMPYDKQGLPDFSTTEGNYFATENSYIVLVYFRPFGARADELVGYAQINTVFQQ